MSDVGFGLSAPMLRSIDRRNFTPRIARRRLMSWGAVQADTVKVTRRETFDYRFQA